MSWVVNAFTLVQGDPRSYYAVVSPVEFYEWRFKGEVPKGVELYKKMPRSDAFTDNQIIVTADLKSNNVPQSGSKFSVPENTPADVRLAVGQLSTPAEIMSKFSDLHQKFYRSLDGFKRTTAAQKYFTSVTGESQLYRVGSSNDKEVELELIGTVKEIKEKLSQVLGLLRKQSGQKKWRAYEMETFTKFDNYMKCLGNSDIPIDASKMEFLLITAQIKPIQNKVITWEQCFLETSAEASEMQTKLNAFNSMNWVKHAKQYLSK